MTEMLMLKYQIFITSISKVAFTGFNNQAEGPQKPLLMTTSADLTDRQTEEGRCCLCLLIFYTYH